MKSRLGPFGSFEIVCQAYGIYFGHILRILIIGAGIGLALYATFTLLHLSFLSNTQTPANLDELLSFKFLRSSIPTTLYRALVTPILAGALVYAVSQSLLRGTIGVADAFRAALSRAGALIVSQALVGLVVIVLLLLAWFSLRLIAGGSGPVDTFRGIVAIVLLLVAVTGACYYAVTWALISQAVMIDGCGSASALTRSQDLVRGHRMRVFGVIALLLASVCVLCVWIGMVFAAAVPLLELMITPVTIIGPTFLYFDLRFRREGFSLPDLSAALDIPIDPDYINT